jgi:hypothetical protein
MFPRSKIQFETLCREGRVWCAVAEDGNYLGLTFLVFEEGEVEIGGLFVPDDQRGNGLGLLIVFLVIGIIVALEDKLLSDADFVFYVHSGKEAVGKTAERFLKCIDGGRVFKDPKECGGMAVGPSGQVEGKKYFLRHPDSFVAIADWLSLWRGRLANGSPVTIEAPGDLSVADIISSLRSVAKQQQNRMPEAKTANLAQPREFSA